MTITALGTNGCETKKTYKVANSRNPTGGIVSPGGTVNLCTPIVPLEFAISNWGTNPPDTRYNINYGDGITLIVTQVELESSTFYNIDNPAASGDYPVPHEYMESNCPDSNYTVFLDIITSCGVSNFTAGPITILQKPELSFDAGSIACAGINIPINNISSTGYNPGCTDGAEWFWDMGDGTLYNVFEPIHSYSAPGNYIISLYAENFCGEVEPITQPICIEAPLNPTFTVDRNEDCAPFNMVFNNTTALTNQCDTPNYEWIISYTSSFCGLISGANFINGTTLNSENPDINFVNPGAYELILQTTNSCGIASSEPQEIIVKSPPQVTINSIEDFCETDPIITPSAIVNDCGPINATYLWSIDIGSSPNDWEFINGTNENSELPEISFNTPNTYTLSLLVTNNCGFNSDDAEFVFSPVPSITNAVFEQTICSGTTTEDIIFTSSDPDTSYSWSGVSPTGNITGILNPATTNTIASHILNINGGTTGRVIYTVTPFLVANCPGEPFDFIININEGPSIATQPLDGAYCIDAASQDLTFTLGGAPADTIDYQWYYNTTATNSITDPNTVAVPNPEGQQADYQPPTDTLGTLYYFCVVSFGGTGSCNEIVTLPAEILVTPNVVISNETPLNQRICLGANAGELSFTTNSAGPGIPTYNWYLSDDTVIDNSDTLVGAAATYAVGVLDAPGVYYYYVTIDLDENLGCSDVSSEMFTVEVVEDPEVIITPVDQTICTNVAADLLVAEVSGGIDSTTDGIIDNTDYQFQWFLNGTAITETNNTDNDLSTFNHDNTLPAGIYNYYCEISQSNGLDCNGTSNVVTITVNAGPSIAVQPVANDYCLGDAINALEVTIANPVGVANYQWYSNTTNDTDTPSPIGTDSNILTIPNSNLGIFYYYCVINFPNGGCDDLVSEIVAITINQVPEISDYNQLICSNNIFVVLPDDSNGDTVPTNTTYTWGIPVIVPEGAVIGALEASTPVDNIAQFLENTTTNPATVTYTVTPTAGDCTGDTFDIVVVVNPSISVSETLTDKACFEANTASIEISVVGGVPFLTANPYLISWVGPNGFTSNEGNIFNLEAGEYTLNIEDNGGCPYEQVFSVNEPEELIFEQIDFDPQTISCFGANDGNISIALAGGTLPYSYNWTLDGLPFSTDEDLSNLGPGTYEITATDVNNCGPITQIFIIEEPLLLEVSLNAQTNVLCFGEASGAIAIDVIGGRPAYTFAWIGPNGFVSNDKNIEGLMAGQYTVTVTDMSDCFSSLNITLVQNDQIIIDVTTTEIECYGDNDASIIIDTISGGIGPYVIAWSNFGTGNSQNNLSAGTFTITITDSENCNREFPIVIEEPPLFLIEPVVTQMSCSGENDASINLNFQGGVAPVTVVWDDDSTAGVTRNNLAPGTYAVTITDGTPCVIEDSFTIFDILPIVLSANITNALDCDDTNSGAINLLITGGTSPFTISWSNGTQTEDLENVPPNTYIATVTDANGCEIEGSWEVNRFQPLVVEVDTQSEVDCEAKTVDQTFAALASGGSPPFVFSWSSGTVSGANNELMTTDENGLVVLEVVDSLGCTTNFSFNVEIPTLGDSGFDSSSIGTINYGIFAIQDPIQFTNTATGDILNVFWDFGDGSFSAEENPIHTYIKVGNYVVTQTVNYPFGCVDISQVTLIVEKGYKLVMPDAFTPNEDGLNDFFGPKHIGLNRLEISIYDTWGSLIYSEKGDDILGWNGKINEEDAENGNYYYTFKAVTFYEDVIEKQGAFVFIK